MDEQLTLDLIAKAVGADPTPEAFTDALAVLTAFKEKRPIEESAYARWFRERAADAVARGGRYRRGAPRVHRRGHRAAERGFRFRLVLHLHGMGPRACQALLPAAPPRAVPEGRRASARPPRRAARLPLDLHAALARRNRPRASSSSRWSWACTPSARTS